MAARPDDLQSRIEAAERAVYAADARASQASQRLRAHWRARVPTLVIGSASAVIAWQLLRSRRRAHIAYRTAASHPWLATLDSVLRVGGPRLTTAISALVAGIVAKKTHRPLSTAPEVDLQRYSGLWYEIARLPERHEKDCASDVTANYRVLADGTMQVLNQCRRRDGRIKRVLGRVRVTDGRSNARLKVSFAPELLDPIPLVWSDYCIIDIAADYSAAVVGTPDRAHLWLLARTPTVGEQVRSAFVAKALAQGYDTSRLIYTVHTPRAASTGVQPSTPESTAQPATERAPVSTGGSVPSAAP